MSAAWESFQSSFFVGRTLPKKRRVDANGLRRGEPLGTQFEVTLIQKERRVDFFQTMAAGAADRLRMNPGVVFSLVFGPDGIRG